MTVRPSSAFAFVLLAAIGTFARSAEPSASVTTVSFDSPSVGRKMAYNITLPAGYDTSSETRYPVVYLLHGFTSNYSAWAQLGAGRAAKGLDLIVVMPDAGNSWYVNWAESDEGQKNAWEDAIIKDLIGHVDSTYRTIAKREGRAINGLSMGGYGGLTLGLRHPELFCSIGSHSGAIGFARAVGDRLRKGETVQSPPPAANSDKPNAQIQIEGFQSRAERSPKGKIFLKAEDADAADPFKLVLAIPKEKLPHIYVDCGTEDRLIASSREFAKLLIENNIPFTYSESPGGHVPAYWSREIGTSVALQYLIIKRSLAAQAESKDPKP